MLSSKTLQTNIESNRSFYILIGYVIALSFMYVLLEWRSGNSNGFSFFDDEYVFREDFIPIIWDIPEEEIPPPVSPSSYQEQEINPQKTKITNPDEIVVVKNNSPENIQENGSKETPVQETPLTEEPPPIRELDQMPEFPGGVPGLRSYIFKNLIYPLNDLKAGIHGTVLCSFVVSAEGKVSDVQIIQGKSTEMDSEAIRVILQMPKWRPGTKDGKNIPARCVLPIVFRLN